VIPPLLGQLDGPPVEVVDRGADRHAGDHSGEQLGDANSAQGCWCLRKLPTSAHDGRPWGKPVAAAS
jgi:hypothetical protein